MWLCPQELNYLFYSYLNYIRDWPILMIKFTNRGIEMGFWLLTSVWYTVDSYNKDHLAMTMSCISWIRPWSLWKLPKVRILTDPVMNLNQATVLWNLKMSWNWYTRNSAVCIWPEPLVPVTERPIQLSHHYPGKYMEYSLTISSKITTVKIRQVRGWTRTRHTSCQFSTIDPS